MQGTFVLEAGAAAVAHPKLHSFEEYSMTVAAGTGTGTEGL